MMPAKVNSLSVRRKKGSKSESKAYPEANIVAVDYDPGASEVNQLNRIKLMLSGAKDALAAQPL